MSTNGRSQIAKYYRQKTRTFLFGFFGIKGSRCPTLTWGDPTLPSALSSFTSEFEMGSGGSYLLFRIRVI